MQKPIKEIEQLLHDCNEHLDNHPLLAEESALQALALSSKCGYEEGRFESLFSMSCIRNKLSQHDRALKTFDECLKIAEDLKDPKRVAQTKNALGITYNEMHVCSRALGYFLEALDIAGSNGLAELECQVNNNIASVFLDLKDYHRGLSFLLDAYRKALSVKAPVALYLRNIANCSIQMKQYDKAYEYCLLARNANWHERDEEVSADIYFILAVTLAKKERPLRSKKAFNLGFELSRRYNTLYSRAEGYIDLAETYIESGQYTRALECLDEALQISELNGFSDHFYRIYLLSIEAYRMTGDSEKEKMAHRQYLSIAEKRLERDNSIKRAYAAMQLDNSRLDKEPEIMKHEVIDTLTGFLNDSDYQSRISAALEASDNHGALLILNVDNLKPVNGNYGHPAGDKLIIEFTGTLDKVFGDAVKVRKSGDEFLVFLPRAGRSYVVQLLDELFSRLIRPRVIGKSLTPLSCSAGIAIAPGDSVLLKELEAMATVALFHAKRSGKRSSCFYDSLIVTTPVNDRKAT